MTSLSPADWRRERWSSSRAWTACSKARRWQPAWPATVRNGDRMPARNGAKAKKDGKNGARKGDRNESLDAVHPATGRHIAVDDSHYARGRCGLLPTPGVGPAASGLPDDPGRDVLSGSES